MQSLSRSVFLSVMLKYFSDTIEKAHSLCYTLYLQKCVENVYEQYKERQRPTIYRVSEQVKIK